MCRSERQEGVYHCSLHTMYRLLEQEGETRERRDQLTHPPYQKPELLATAPNQLGLLRNARGGGADGLRVARGNRDPRALGCQRLGDGEPQPLAGGRYHGYLSFDA